MIGTILDEKYRIDRLLGEGGMGAVYAAEDVRDGQEVAVKVIHANLPARTPDILARFEREARAAAGVDTEHIVRCLDSGIDAATGQPFMVLEYLTGEDFQRVLRRTGPVAPDLALRVAAQAGAGLARAHEANIIHRDIKPANLFLAQRKGREGERVVKILDFGVAKIRKDPSEEGADNDGLTRTGSMLGSPLYMSPEQARSVKSVDQRADIWSLGVVIYKALAGRTPFDHISSLGDLVLALWNEPPPPVQQFAPWVPPEVASLLDRMLRVEPDERFQTMAEVLGAIAPLLPGGTAVLDEMLAPIPQDVRQRTAATYFRRFDTRPRLRTEPTPPGAVPLPAGVHAPAPSDNRSSAPSDNRSSAPENEGANDARPPPPRGAVTQSGLSTTDAGSAVAARPRRMGAGTLIAIAAVGLGVGLGGTLLLLPESGSGAAPSASVAAEIPATTAPAVTPADTGAPAQPSATPASAASSAPEAPPAASPSAAIPSAAIPSGAAAFTPSAVPATAGVPRPAAAQPKATGTAGPARPPATGPTFTDFGDRK